MAVQGSNQATTTLPINFGATVSCTADLDVSGNLIFGPQVLAEALIRRISTPAGRLLDDPDYGFDVTGMINDDILPAEVNKISGLIDQEFLKDERVSASVTSATFVAGVLTTTSLITTGNGPFRLVLNVTQVTVALLQVTPAVGAGS